MRTFLFRSPHRSRFETHVGSRVHSHLPFDYVSMIGRSPWPFLVRYFCRTACRFFERHLTQFHGYTYAPLSSSFVSPEPWYASITRVARLERLSTIPFMVPTRQIHPIHDGLSRPFHPSSASDYTANPHVSFWLAHLVPSCSGSIDPIALSCCITCRIFPCITNVWLSRAVGTSEIGFLGSPRSPTTFAIHFLSLPETRSWIGIRPVFPSGRVLLSRFFHL